MSTAPSAASSLPARSVPLFYIAFAHLCLALAGLALALDPRSLGGFYYNPRLLAVVHLVTLGWISGSILGWIYVVGPLALRLPLPERRLDRAAAAAFATGVAGMASHFWIDSPGGMAWSAGLVAAGVLPVAVRVLAGLRHAPVPLVVRLHVAAAFVNFLATTAFGVLLGINKVHPVLPGYVLANVAAHAHLAALGWAATMVVGAGYRMLPMMLPSAMPKGAGPWTSLVLLTTGAWGLCVTLAARSGWVGAFALVSVLGLAAFGSQVVWMLRHPKPPPSERPRPDLGVAHAGLALACLALACALGLGLAFSQDAEWSLPATFAYGVLGLLGFLAQMVVGVGSRVLPLVAWLWGFASSDYAAQPPSLHAATDRRLQAAGLVLWAAAVPLIAWGLTAGRPRAVSLGGWALVLAVVAGAVNVRRVVARLAPQR